MKRLVLLSTLAIAVSALYAARSEATPIGPSCGTCQGSIYELTYSGVPIATTATTQTWQITYTIDTSGYNGGGTRLTTVSLKVSDSLVNADLVSGPGGVANWVEFMGGLNSSGCSGAGSGFDCVTVAALSSAPVVPDGVYTWVFNLEMDTGVLFTGLDQSTVKARYSDELNHKVGALVSESITLEVVPEPSTALLVALGGILLAVRRSRRA